MIARLAGWGLALTLLLLGSQFAACTENQEAVERGHKLEGLLDALAEPSPTPETYRELVALCLYDDACPAVIDALLEDRKNRPHSVSSAWAVYQAYMQNENYRQAAQALEFLEPAVCRAESERRGCSEADHDYLESYVLQQRADALMRGIILAHLEETSSNVMELLQQSIDIADRVPHGYEMPESYREVVEPDLPIAIQVRSRWHYAMNLARFGEATEAREAFADEEDVCRKYHTLDVCAKLRYEANLILQELGWQLE